MRLGPRAEEPGRDARHRRRADAGAVAVQRSAGREGDGMALDDDGGLRAAGAIGSLHAATDALHDPHVLTRWQQGVVVSDDGLGGLGHLFLAHANVDAQVAQGVVQAVNVAVQPEGLAAESTGCVEHRVTVQKPPVVYGEANLTPRHHLPVEIDDHFVCHHQNSQIILSILCIDVN